MELKLQLKDSHIQIEIECYIPECEPNGITALNLWEGDKRVKLRCNMLNCDKLLFEEAFLCPCDHVFCFAHSPWNAGITNLSPTGFQCVLCATPAGSDSEQFVFSVSLNMRGNNQALTGVLPKQLATWMRHSTNTWMLQSRSRLKQEIELAQKAHVEKQRRIAETRAKTAEIRRTIEELKTFKQAKLLQEKQLKQHIEAVEQRCTTVNEMTSSFCHRSLSLKTDMKEAALRNRQLTDRLAQADNAFHQLIIKLNRTNRLIAIARDDLRRRQRRQQQQQQQQPGNQRDCRERHEAYGSRHGRSRSRDRRRDGVGDQRLAEAIAPLIVQNARDLYEFLDEPSPEPPPCFRVHRR